MCSASFTSAVKLLRLPLCICQHYAATTYPFRDGSAEQSSYHTQILFESESRRIQISMLRGKMRHSSHMASEPRRAPSVVAWQRRRFLAVSRCCRSSHRPIPTQRKQFVSTDGQEGEARWSHYYTSIQLGRLCVQRHSHQSRGSEPRCVTGSTSISDVHGNKGKTHTQNQKDSSQQPHTKTHTRCKRSRRLSNRAAELTFIKSAEDTEDENPSFRS